MAPGDHLSPEVSPSLPKPVCYSSGLPGLQTDTPTQTLPRYVNNRLGVGRTFM